ncbi:MAG: folate family ECF transporter S component [Christensenellales bacterium]
MSRNTKVLTSTALMITLCAILNIYAIKISDSVQIVFTYTICFIAGVFFGPICGFATGFLGDLIGCILAPQGAYLPTVGISLGLWGVIPWAVFRLFNRLPYYVNTVIAFILCLLICTVGINMTTFYFVFSKMAGYLPYVMSHLPVKLILVAVNCVVCIIAYPLFSRLYQKEIVRN